MGVYLDTVHNGGFGMNFPDIDFSEREA